MKRILVVSDNAELSEFFMQEWARQRLGECARVRYCYSTVNRSPEAMSRLGASAIDMKDDGTATSIGERHDLIFSLHCKQIFPARVVARTPCFNVHPGMNPWNRGWYPQVFSLVNHLPAGATIHLMDAEVDHGPIVAQLPVPVYSEDTSLDVYRRVVEAEKLLLREHLSTIVDGTFTCFPPPEAGNYNSIQDFKRLCRLDLDARGTLREHLDLLRALTHGNYRNAYFVDEAGDAVYVRVHLEKVRPTGPEAGRSQPPRP